MSAQPQHANPMVRPPGPSLLGSNFKPSLITRPSSNLGGGTSSNKLQKLPDKDQDDVIDVTEDEEDSQQPRKDKENEIEKDHAHKHNMSSNDNPKNRDETPEM